MERRTLGKSSLAVSAVGLGCMSMSNVYGKGDEAECIAVVHRALDLGVNFLDSSDAYGWGQNEDLLGRALRGHRDQVVLATKFGNFRKPDGTAAVSGRPEYVPQACDASLKRLGVSTIDLYLQHRVDPSVPIEETVGAMAGLVKAGKVRYLGLSEAGPDSLRRASKIHPITALQTEYSLWARDVEDEILPAIRELGIGLVAYSPLGRGFLSGRIHSVDDLEASDFRRANPRFQGESFQKNLDLVERVEELAASKGCTAAQIALAWVLAQGEDIVPIPGTTRVKNLEENVSALDVELSDEELRDLEAVFPKGAAGGDRYADMSPINR